MDPLAAGGAVVRTVPFVVKAARKVRPLRRRLLTRGLRTLEPGNTLGTFLKVLGETRSSRVQDDGRVAHGWRTEDVDARALTASVYDSTVLAYGVRRRAKGYRPRVNLTPNSGDPLRVRLGRTLFGDVATPIDVDGWLGASDWDYRELFWLGRPGGYRHYALNGYGPDAPAALFEYLRSLGNGRSGSDDELWLDARASLRVEGYAVYDAAFERDDWRSL